ncbi:MAG: phenylacetic acid degradation b [Streptosporangiales bacterium]|nr:phenylacetic acid degradation b [Streptosporangiales bacterium]
MSEPAAVRKTFDPERERGGLTPRYYEVFARKSSDDHLAHVGSVEAPNDDLAQVRAWYIYDQHSWKEMCVVPTEAIIPVRIGKHSTRIKMA